MPIELTSNIVPKNNGAFPTHEAIYGRGGRREVDTIQDRDAIVAARRTAGMQVYVRSDQKTYVLQVNLTAWVEDPLATRLAAVESTLSGLNKGSVGLGNVDNTADNAKPVSVPQAAAISSAVSASTGNFVVKSTRQLKTSAYTALIGDLIALDTSGGTFATTLPLASTGKGRVAVKWAIGTAAPTIVLSGSDAFDKSGGSTTITPPYLSQSYVFESDGINVWTIVAGDTALNTLLAGGTGGQQIGHVRAALTKDLTTLGDYINAGAVSVWEYVDLITVKPDPNDWSTWDWGPAFTGALNTSKRVFVPQRDGTVAYRTSAFTMARGDAELIVPASQNILVIGVADDGYGVTLTGDSAKISGGIWRVDNPLANIIRTAGFRNLLYDVKSGTGSVGGCKNALTVDGLETIVNLGRYRSGSSAGILVTNYDLYLQNVYCEQNRVGLRSDGFGSITAHHVHAFSNTVSGFYLSGAAYSQLTACYADTNGQNGYEIRDTTAGLTLIDCWGYKSSNASAGWYDFAFYSAQQVRMLGGNSNGTGLFAKGASVRLNSDSIVEFIGFRSELPLSSNDGTTALQKSAFTNCSGTFRRYNKPANRSTLGGQSVAATGGTVAISISIPITTADFATPGNIMFQVKILGRSTAGGGTSRSGTFDVMVGLGGVAGSVLAQYTSDFAISAVTLTDNVDGTCQMAFTVTNSNALAMQITAFVDYYGTSRGTG